MTVRTKRKKLPALRFPEFEGKWESKKGKELFRNKRLKGNAQLPIYSVTMDRGLVLRDSLDRRMGNDAEAEKNLQANPMDLVYNMMRMWQGAVGICYTNCMVSPAYIVLEPKKTVESKFFVQAFQTKQYLYLLKSYSYGLTNDRLRLYFKDFAVINFVVPPLPEQQKIAAFLTSIDTRIQQLTRKVELLEQYKKGVMQQIFAQAIRFKPDSRAGSDEQGRDFPAWEEKRLGEVAKIITGKTPRTNDRDYWDGPILFVTPTDISDHQKYLTHTQRTVTQFRSIKILPLKSIMYTCIASIGKMSLSVKPSITNQQINSVIPNKATDNEYLYYSLQFLTPYIKSTQANNTLPIINKTEFSKSRIPYPTLPEQQKIADFLSAIDRKITQTKDQLDHMRTFKKGLLQQLFV